jgi:hypothetical protein
MNPDALMRAGNEAPDRLGQAPAETSQTADPTKRCPRQNTHNPYCCTEAHNSHDSQAEDDDDDTQVFGDELELDLVVSIVLCDLAQEGQYCYQCQEKITLPKNVSTPTKDIDEEDDDDGGEKWR